MKTPYPIPEDVYIRANMVINKNLPISGNISSDKTGRFPVTSSRGRKYIMFMEDYGSNSILTETITSRTKTELLRAITKLYQNLKVSGLQPHLQLMDSKCSSPIKEFITEVGDTHQLVPQILKRDLIAEREIQTFKYYLIAGLSSYDITPPPTHLVTDHPTVRTNVESPAPWPHEPLSIHRGIPTQGLQF